MSKNSDPTFWLVIGLGAGLVTFFRGFKVYREYRVVDDTPRIPIRSVPMGLVNIQGKATGEERLTSPLTHTSCFFYKVEIEEWKQDGNKSGWKHYRTDTGGVKFYLEDASGKVLVDAQNAEFDLEMACERQVGGNAGRSVSSLAGGAATDAEILSYISQAGASRITSFIEHRLEAAGPLHDTQKEQSRQQLMEALKNPPGSPGFSQGIMAMMSPMIGKRLAEAGPQANPEHEQARLALAEVFKHPVGSPEFLEQVRHAQTLFPQGSEEGQKITAWVESMQQHTRPEAFFPPATGRFRLKECCIVLGQQYEVVGTCAENPSPKDEHDRNLIMKGTNEPTYLISDKPRSKAEGRLRTRSLKMVLGGAALTIICLGLLLARFGLF